MVDTLFSASWYRVADLKPRLRRHVQLHRHDYRGQLWYVLQDHAGGRSHRFTPAAYQFVGLMDGERKVHQLWEAVGEASGDEAPTQDEIIRLLGQLHAADALICDVPPDTQELFRRFSRHQRQQLKQRFWTPLAVRMPLWDPDRFLERTYPLVSFLFSRFGALLWLLVTVTGAVLALTHWSELTENIVDRALTPQNLLLLWFIYPVVKALHELGHGYAAKHAGGEVHEIGIMFLVLVPVPYVDVSSAWGLRDKYQRMLIGGAGIAVELFLGSLAMVTWLSVEPGTVHAVAYNVMLISGVSTLLFNGNPLLRFDGYYVFADALEIPNLGTRSNRYLGYLIQKYVFGSRDEESPANAPGERFWLAVYGVASFIYRMFIMFVIIMYIGAKFFTVGLLLAAWAIFTQIFLPVGKTMVFLFGSPRLRRNRRRSLLASAGLLGAAVLLLFVLPAPFWTRAEGVTWPIEQSNLRAGADGFVAEILVEPGTRVQQGQPLVVMQDDLLRSRLEVLRARRLQLENQLRQASVVDRVQTAILREEMAAISADIERVSEQYTALTVLSPRDGVLVIPDAQDLPGRFIRKGERLGFVRRANDPVMIQVAVPHDRINLVNATTRAISVMPSDWGARAVDAQLQRSVPGGTTRLPTPALGSMGGGSIAVDPREADGRVTMERVFELELALPETVQSEFLGRQVYVRFDHGYKPLGLQLYQALRLLLLRHLNV